MKAFLKKYKYWIIGGGVLFLVVIPLLINHLFQQPAPLHLLHAKWHASDALSFYGTLLSSVATIAGVFWSIEYAQRNYRQDERNRVKPYFALTHYSIKFKVNLLSSPFEKNENLENDEAEYYEEFKPDKVYLCICSNGINYKTRLTNAEMNLIHSRGSNWRKTAPDCYARIHQDYISMPFEAENVGLGSAINTWVALYKEGEKESATPFYTQNSGASIYIHIFSNLPAKDVEGKYVIELLYSDILGNRYSQKYPLELFVDSKTQNLCQRIDMTGIQEMQEETTNGKNENGVN